MKDDLEILSRKHFDDIERVPVLEETLRTFANEDEFNSLAVNLLIEVGNYAAIGACLRGKSPTWDRNTAAIGGNIVRIYKLLNGVLDQTCQKRQEITFILTRLVFETVVNVRFMIANGSDSIASYVETSFRHERKLRDTIQEKIHSRGGSILPIEDRMLKSIYRSANTSGL